MSGNESTTKDAASVEALASRWLERRHFNVWGEEESAALEAWLAQSPSHEVAYLRLEAAWSRTERLAALHTPAAENEMPQKTRRPMFRGVAAVFFAVTIAGVGAGLLLSRPKETIYTTALGQRQTVRLGDGSQIELNTDTVLRTKFSAHQRLVLLDKGEAYFQVRHDASRPFAVIAGEHRVTDLGTKFLMHRDEDRLEVSVVEGRVRFEAADGQTQSPATLRPGDAAVVTAHAISVTRKSAAKLAGELGWRNGLLVFDHTTLADAADEINRYNGKKLVIADADAARLMIGGTFPVNNVMAIAEAAQDSFGLRIEKRGDEIVISR